MPRSQAVAVVGESCLEVDVCAAFDGVLVVLKRVFTNSALSVIASVHRDNVEPTVISSR